MDRPVVQVAADRPAAQVAADRQAGQAVEDLREARQVRVSSTGSQGRPMNWEASRSRRSRQRPAAGVVPFESAFYNAQESKGPKQASKRRDARKLLPQR